MNHSDFQAICALLAIRFGKLLKKHNASPALARDLARELRFLYREERRHNARKIRRNLKHLDPAFVELLVELS